MQNTMVSALGALVCWSTYLQGDFERALELLAQVRGIGGCGAMIGAIEALALIQAGPTEASIERIEAMAAEYPRSQTLLGFLGYAYAMTKHTGRALDILQILEHPGAQGKPNNSYGRALVLIGLGPGRQAAPWLEAAYAEGSLWSLGFGSDPVLRRLRGDAGFDLLLHKIGNSAAKPVQRLYSLELFAGAAPAELSRRSERNLA